MYFAIITTGVLVSSLQDHIGTSVSNHPHNKGQKTTSTNAGASEWLQCCTKQAQNAKNVKIWLFDRNLRREEKPTRRDFFFGGEGGTTKLFAEKNLLKQNFFLLLHGVMISRYKLTNLTVVLSLSSPTVSSFTTFPNVVKFDTVRNGTHKNTGNQFIVGNNYHYTVKLWLDFE